MTDVMGMDPDQIAPLRTEPWWADLVAMAPTIAFDSAIMGDSQGSTLTTEVLAAVTVPTLVLVGGASPQG
jgi:hypothetical protein